ncbi:MAG TPA: hypothetical protein PKM21_15980 [Anaerolineales bacterium]|nr:hypothetical protein [Anaerolineales bacterium]
MINTDNAQIALLHARGWGLIGPYWCKVTNLPLPLPDLPAGCPVLDDSQVSRAEHDRLMRIHVSPAGVDDVDALVAALTEVGARLVEPALLAEVDV